MPAWQGKGDQSPSSALMEGGLQRCAKTHRGERVLHKPGASLSFLGDPGDGSYDLFHIPLHPYTLHLVFLSLRELNPQSPGGGLPPLGDSNSAPTLLPI